MSRIDLARRRGLLQALASAAFGGPLAASRAAAAAAAAAAASAAAAAAAASAASAADPATGTAGGASATATRNGAAARLGADPAPAKPDAGAVDNTFATVEPGVPLRFPRDFGAHPAFRTEWWYATGWLEREGAAACGFQFTMFRSRTTQDAANPSRFAPKQLLIGHIALALPERGAILHAQRAAREGFGLAWAREGNTDVAIGDWTIVREADRYTVQTVDRELALRLTLQATRPPLLQGEAGYSRKGPLPEQASYYYSEPHLTVAGRVEAGSGAARRGWSVTGSAWLDHEWSTTILDPRAAGWDWIGINLHDGASLMAFRIRGRDGSTLWSHASWADADGRVLARGESRWQPLRVWRSPHSGARYPIEMEVRIGAAVIALQPLLDDQEIDASTSSGTVYWEGAVRAFHRGQEIGRGYLEMTGYAAALKM